MKLSFFKPTSASRWGFATLAVVLLSDQLSKWWVLQTFLGAKPLAFFDFLSQSGPLLPFSQTPITSFFNIVMVWNHGISFGLLQNHADWAKYGLTAVSGVISLGFLAWLWQANSRLLAVALGLVVGGAWGNVFDRVRFGAVVDFLDIYVGRYHWPAFNVADSAVCLGVGLLLWHSWHTDKISQKAK